MTFHSPSHLHAILKPRGRKIGELLKNFGSYTAHELLRQLSGGERIDRVEMSKSVGLAVL